MANVRCRGNIAPKSPKAHAWQQTLSVGKSRGSRCFYCSANQHSAASWYMQGLSLVHRFGSRSVPLQASAIEPRME